MVHWCGVKLHKTYLEKINKTLNRSIRIILFKQKYDIVKYLSILPLKQNIKLQQGKFAWILKSHNLRNCLLNEFSLMHSHTINNVNQQKLIIPCYRTKPGKRYVLCQDYKLWNSKILVNAKLHEITIKTFCRSIRQGLRYKIIINKQKK